MLQQNAKARQSITSMTPSNMFDQGPRRSSMRVSITNFATPAPKICIHRIAKKQEEEKKKQEQLELNKKQPAI